MAADSRKFPRAIERVCETFKISSLYPEQETSLKALVEGKNVYASLPTGYGKSLIFFAAPVLFDEILERPRGSSKILVISPLKTLMEDQVAYLRSLGLSAIARQSTVGRMPKTSGKRSLHVLVCFTRKNAECGKNAKASLQ